MDALAVGCSDVARWSTMKAQYLGLGPDGLETWKTEGRMALEVVRILQKELMSR